MRTVFASLVLLFFPAHAFSQFSITGSSPVEGATSVGTNITLSITFNAPVDTTQPFNQDNSFATNITNISGQYWSADRMTINLIVDLQPSTVYFFGVYSAHPEGGGSLSVPYATHFTTGSSFPSNVYSVSGTVSGGTTGYSPSYSIVAMTVNGVAGSGGPVFVGLSAADVNGNFSIPYVPEGTWYPIAAKDINGDGQIDPSTGDAVAQASAVLVSGGNVSGVSIVFQILPPPHFGYARDTVLAYAQNNLPANRQLRRVDTYNVDSVGGANRWEFYYTVPGNSVVTRVGVEPFGLSADTSTGMWDFVYYNKPIPNVAAAALADSFIAHIENAGGSTFRHQVPDTLVFRSQVTLGDLNWSQFYQMIPDTNQFYWGAQYSYEKVITQDSSYSLQWNLFLGDFLTGNIIAVTGVDEKQQPRIPATFTLDQNYPNPFNPSTTISYGLPVRSLVSLSVFNLLGQEVAVLLNGVEDAGAHQARFDAPGLASGVYFYRLEAISSEGGRTQDYVAVKKLLLVR